MELKYKRNAMSTHNRYSSNRTFMELKYVNKTNAEAKNAEF